MKSILYQEYCIPRNLIQITKQTTLLLIFLISTAFVSEIRAQTAKVSITENNSIKNILHSIEKKTDYLFVYDGEVNLDKKISINVQNKPVVDILNILFKDMDIVYAMEGSNILLMKKKSTSENSIIQQQKSKYKLSGIVVDEVGEPVIGGGVVIKGTNLGTTTDIDGNFTLDVTPQNTLVISYVGFTTQEITIQNQKTLKITLKEKPKELDEVVVIGYGTQKKINLTGSVETIKSDRLANKPVTSVVSALTGEAAGVTVTQNSGQPGPNQGSIRIRGIGTWGDASPLVLVDGISMSLNDVIPSEIESVTVLKDAASAAIYGSRAANGVILITTKQGKKGNISINYDGNVSLQRATRIPTMATSWQYAELYNQMMNNEGKADKDGYTSIFPKDRIERMRNGGDPDKLEGNTDWYDELLQTATQHIHQVSVMGGGDKIVYMGSLGYSKQEGVIPSTSYERYNARINTTTDVTSWLKVGFNLAYLNSTKKETSTTAADAFRRIGRSLPYMPVKFSDGTWSYATAPTNPIRMVSGDYGMTDVSNNSTTLQISPELRLIKGLLIKGVFGYESNEFLTKTFNKTVEYEPFKPAGQAGIIEVPRNKQTDNWSIYRNMTANTSATYENKIGLNNFKLMGGASVESFKYAYTTASRQDFPNNDFSEINAGDPKTAIAEGNSTYSALASLFGRFNYDYSGRYLFEASLRYDGSSKFARGDRWGIFPSFSLGWRISEEAFFSSLKNHIQNFKVRASLGQLGNQHIINNKKQVDYYPSISTIGTGGNYVFDNNILSGYSESTMGNPLITWEKSSNLNIGVDLTLANNKLNLTFDWYRRKTDDILLELPAPTTLGIAAPMQNAGSVENRGWELTIGWRDQIGRDFAYHINFNISDVKNEIIDLRGYKSPTDELTTRIEGEPLDAIYGWKTLGICETQEQYDKYSKVMKTYNANWGIGDLIIDNLNKDDKIDSEDKTVIGNSIPRYTFGLNVGFEYKNFDFSCFLQGVGKADGYVTAEALKAMGINSARKEHYENTFNPANPKPGAFYPRILQNADYNYAYMSHWVQNAAYVRLKNLQLGYTFKLPKLQRLRMYVSGENLLTLTKFRTWDPETPVGTRGSYPNISIYSFGVNLSF